MAAGLMVPLGLAVAAAITVGLYSVIYNLWLSPLKIYPGPISHAISALPLEIARLSGVHHKHLEKLHARYGPVVRVRPTELSVIDGSGWQEVYGHRSGVAEFPKADSGTRSNGAHSILTTPDREQHRRGRRMLAHAFSAQGMREQENRVQHHVDLLIQGLASHAGKEPVNLVEWFNWTSFDIIGDLAFGESFGCLESQSTHEWIQFILASVKAALFIWTAERWGLLPLVGLLIPRRLIEARKANLGFVVDKIHRRTALGKDRGDFWDQVLKHPLLPPTTPLNSPNLKGMTLNEMQSNAGDLVLAGSETTATALSGLIFYLLQHPRVLSRLTTEIRSAFPSEQSITFSALLTSSSSTNTPPLPYLTATLHEILRIYPPAPVATVRRIPPSPIPITFNARPLPAGTRIGIPLLVAFTSPYNFARPRDFVPERWLAVDGGRPKEFEHDNRANVFQPFSYGPRNCVGMNLANAEMRLVVARLLWRFDLAKPVTRGGGRGTDGEEWEGWVERQKVWILWHKGPLMVRVREREGL